jgi:hypothetical protein
LEGRRVSQRLVTGCGGCKAHGQPLSPRSPRLRVRRGRILTLPPIGSGSGRRCPHRHWDWLRNGDEDVATPFRAGAVSGCARETASVWLRLRGFAAYPTPCRGGRRMTRAETRRLREGGALEGARLPRCIGIGIETFPICSHGGMRPNWGCRKIKAGC